MTLLVKMLNSFTLKDVQRAGPLRWAISPWLSWKHFPLEDLNSSAKSVPTTVSVLMWLPLYYSWWKSREPSNCINRDEWRETGEEDLAIALIPRERKCVSSRSTEYEVLKEKRLPKIQYQKPRQASMVHGASGINSREPNGLVLDGRKSLLAASA